jgi:hypothetical protein
MSDVETMLEEIRALVLNQLKRAEENQADAHRAEVARLQEEIDRLKQEEAGRGEANQAEVDGLRQEIERLRAESYVKAFEPGGRWLLLANMRIQLGGKARWMGIAETPDGQVLPFLIKQNADEVFIGREFTAEPERLVGVEAPPSEPAAPPPAVEKPAPPVAPIAPPAPAPAPAAEEATVINWTGSGRAAARPGGPARRAAGKAGEEDGGFMALLDRGGAGDDTLRDESEGLPFLEVLTGPDGGKRFPLDFGITSLGRHHDNTIVLGDNAASRHHAEIDFDGTNFRLTDKESANGTFHQGKQITETILQLGDTVRIGETEMTFTCDGFELMRSDPKRSIEALISTLRRQPDFVPALRTLAFLLDRDVARKKDAQAVWNRLTRLEHRG